MQHDAIKQWQHDHNFVAAATGGEQRTRYVVILTAITMVVEIIAGTVFGSMALLADGWHMGTHVAAFAITLFAYGYARRHANSGLYSFGTGKVSVLGGFTSAVVLIIVAVMMVVESMSRMFDAHPIQFNQAIAVAIVGLLVNLLSAWMLQGDHHHHEHDHDHHDHHEHHDHNLRAAYLHVLADALTSVAAIIALLSGKYLGWMWMDPLMGIVGALVISRWAMGLLRDTSGILLDKSEHADVYETIKQVIEADGNSHITDLHVWRVGPNHLAAIISVASQDLKAPEHYKQLLKNTELAHVTVEVNKIKITV
jgi:cation diffusion facilitator family transporter